MPKRNKKVAARKIRTAPPAVVVAGIFVGARVKVKAGDYGNATGTVSGVSAQGVLVRLDTVRQGEPLPFDSANLIAA